MPKESVPELSRQFRSDGEGRPTRTTVVLSEGLNFALEVYSFKHGIPKGEVVRDAIRAKLKADGVDPKKLPNLLRRLATAR